MVVDGKYCQMDAVDKDVDMPVTIEVLRKR
jgi:hypothetical protein